MSDIIVNVHLEAAEGKGDELAAVLSQLLVPTRAEEGNVQYDFHRDLKDPQKFMFYEIWKSREAIKSHGGQDHYRDVTAKAAPLLAKPPVMATFAKIEP